METRACLGCGPPPWTRECEARSEHTEKRDLSTTRMTKQDAEATTLYISVTGACAPKLREPKTRTSTEFELKFQTLPVSVRANVSLVVAGLACCLPLADARCCFLPRLTPAVHDVRPFLHLDRRVVSHVLLALKATIAAVLESTRPHLWMYNGGSSLCSTRCTTGSPGKPNQCPAPHARHTW